MSAFSVIIPCYHDELKLAQLLDQLWSLPRAPKEIIVVDGAASQACMDICQRKYAVWIASEPCRGKQLLAGARSAHGDVFWFLHADARLCSNPITAMELALHKGAIGGYFRFVFDAPRTLSGLVIEIAIAIRCKFGVPYGDQGLFMSRQAYLNVGGHAPWPLFEEVPLVKGLRKSGRFVALNEPIWVDARRWHRDGWWKRTWQNRSLALAFMRGESPQVLANRYRVTITQTQQHSQ
jgi:rSAM/selenodomain-associated transferase 2